MSVAEQGNGEVFGSRGLGLPRTAVVLCYSAVPGWCGCHSGILVASEPLWAKNPLGLLLHKASRSGIERQVGPYLGRAKVQGGTNLGMG